MRWSLKGASSNGRGALAGERPGLTLAVLRWWGIVSVTLLFAVALAGSSASGRTWYVDRAGSDSSPGTKNRPFRSWQHAVSLARAGDTILLQPGVHTLSGRRSYGVRLARSGTRSAPITLRGDGGRATLDCSHLQSDWGIYCLDVRASWWRIQDVAVSGARQARAGAWAIGIHLADASDNRLERVASFRNQGPGILITGRSSRNRIEDCDAHHNYDPRTTPRGDNADGVQLVGLPASAVGNRLVRCRAWANSDDGYDLWKSEAPVTIEGSWAFANGWVPDTREPAGNGSGFKLGRNARGPGHRVARSLAFVNRTIGFDSNGARGQIEISRSIAYRNGEANFVFDEDSFYLLSDNVSVGAPNRLGRRVRQVGNSWNTGFEHRFDSLAGLTVAAASAPRFADGRLPRIGLP